MIPKLIALDLDDTLLDRESRLSPGNRAALERAISRGIEVVIATGRPLDTVPEEMKTFPGIRYAITGNGAAVQDVATGETLLRRVLTPDAVEQILSLTMAQPLTYEAFIDGKAYAQEDYIAAPERYMADAMTKTYVQTTRRPVPDIVAFLREHRAELDSIDLVVQDLEVKARMMERLHLVEDVYITTSVPRLLELSHRDCGKHRGLAFLAEKLGISRQDTAAFGNADNDAEMLAWAGVGIAVENASPACLAAADHVTAAHWDDGVAKALKTLFGI